MEYYAKPKKCNLTFVQDSGKKVDKRNGAFSLRIRVTKCDCNTMQSNSNRIDVGKESNKTAISLIGKNVYFCLCLKNSKITTNK